MRPLELWGGVECTCNRIGDDYHDQLTRTGHSTRASDLDRFAALGLRTLRYPILWEHVAPHGLEQASWAWADQRLAQLRALAVRPIAGLVHHGSGPKTTSLVDPSFVDGLAAYAGAVAARYPWIDAYTPVNEPLTTARFSALYGHWYPHVRTDAMFVQALLNQVLATRAAMRAIRRVNPAAQLIQTEDVCEATSTPPLAYQADFENARRWLSLDLLAGRVDRSHPLHGFLTRAGIRPRTLDDLAADPCPPDIIGMNYYLTSDRYLDHRAHLYSAGAAGDNGRDRYVDIEAVRVPGVGLAGHERLLRTVSERYGVPVALTEVHAACSREEQVRWFATAWRAATAARERGVNVVAVTAWSLLGAFDWDSLVTRDRGHYEGGAFDIRSDPPRLTAVGGVLRAVAATGRLPDLPVLDVDGWWQREPASSAAAPPRTEADRPLAAHRPRRTPRRLLITGHNGTLGRALAIACAARGLPYLLFDRPTMDVADAQSVADAVDRHTPWAILNAAGYVSVDAAEEDATRCQRENTQGAGVLAAASAARKIRLVTFSSDLVFDGATERPYVESDAPHPLNAYGRSKRAAEVLVAGCSADALIIRTSAFFGPFDAHNFVTRSLDRLRAGGRVRAPDDVTVTATYVPDLANTVLDLLIDGEQGIWHLSNPGPLTWYELACRAARRAGFDPAAIDPVPAFAMGWRARRPSYSALASARAEIMRPIDAALDAYVLDATAAQPQVEWSYG